MDLWAILELMGHVKLAGKVSEEEQFGSKMGRIDIPSRSPCDKCSGMATEFLQANPCAACDGLGYSETWSTQFFGGASVYRMTPVTEEVARVVAGKNAPAPISPWDMPKRLAAPVANSYGSDHDEDEYDDGN